MLIPFPPYSGDIAVDFACYVARNRLTGGFMAENTDLGKLKRHILAKADPGKNVSIYIRNNFGGEREHCRMTVPMSRKDRPSVPTKEKAKKETVHSFEPIVTYRWTIKAIHEFGQRVRVSIRQNDWPEGTEFIITYVKGRFSITFPNGEKSATTTNKLEERFGKAMTDAIFNFFDVAIEVPA